MAWLVVAGPFGESVDAPDPWVCGKNFHTQSSVACVFISFLSERLLVITLQHQACHLIATWATPRIASGGAHLGYFSGAVIKKNIESPPDFCTFNAKLLKSYSKRQGAAGPPCARCTGAVPCLPRCSGRPSLRPARRRPGAGTRPASIPPARRRLWSGESSGRRRFSPSWPARWRTTTSR